MIEHQDRYLNYIKEQGVGAKDKVPNATPKSYISFLGRVSRILGVDISPELLNCEQDIERIKSQIKSQIIGKSFGNVVSAMRQYVSMVSAVGLWPAKNLFLPEEIADPSLCFEGAARIISVNAYERNPEARLRCIKKYGPTCCICQFDFGEVYGEVATGYIHVHHLRPLSEIGVKYVVNPERDLRPVCPNCHAVLHRRDPPYNIDEVKAFLTGRQNRQTRH